MNDNRNFQKNKVWMLQLLEWGVPSIVIQKVLDISGSTVVNYLENLRESGEWKKEINRLDRSQLLLLYAQMKYRYSPSFQSNTLKEKLIEVLVEVLEEEKIVQTIAYALPAIMSFTELRYGDDVPMGYRRLLEHLWPKYDSSFPSLERVLWTNYLHKLAISDISVPETKQCIWGSNHFVNDIIQSYAKEVRDYVAPTFTHRISVIIDTALKTVPPRTREIIERYYGVHSDHESLEAIGQKLSIEKERVRQIREKTLRKLKRVLKNDLKPVSNAWENQQLLRESHLREIQELQNYAKQIFSNMEQAYKNQLTAPGNTEVRVDREQALPRPEESKDLLLTIDELDMSVRAYNCLRSADIEYLWELVQCTRTDVGKFRNLGRISVEEIEELLAKKGLYFGMKFTDTELAYFKERST